MNLEYLPNKLGNWECAFETEGNEAEKVNVEVRSTKDQEYNCLTQSRTDWVGWETLDKSGGGSRDVHEATEKLNVLCIGGPLPERKWSCRRSKGFWTKSGSVKDANV